MSKPELLATAAAATLVTVTLGTPIVRGDQTVGMIQIRKPKSGELRGLSMVDLVKLEVDVLHTLLPRITIPNLTEVEVAALDPSDLFQCATEVAGFFLPAGMTANALTSPPATMQ